MVDFGSLDINGNNRYLFSESSYIGVDIGPGPNVDVISKAHCYNPSEPIDTVISTEMLEHDEHWDSSLRHAVDILRPGGLLVVTCAGLGRAEHGTSAHGGDQSPYTNHYYKNLSQEMVEPVLWHTGKLAALEFSVDEHDLRFFAIKN